MKEYPHAKTEVNRATVLLALRGVGDHDAIQFLESVLDFGEPWADTKKICTSGNSQED